MTHLSGFLHRGLASAAVSLMHVVPGEIVYYCVLLFVFIMQYNSMSAWNNSLYNGLLSLKKTVFFMQGVFLFYV